MVSSVAVQQSLALQCSATQQNEYRLLAIVVGAEGERDGEKGSSGGRVALFLYDVHHKLNVFELPTERNIFSVRATAGVKLHARLESVGVRMLVEP